MSAQGTGAAEAAPAGAVLVTGAGGFVGAALVRRLAASGRRVSAAVRTLPAQPVPAGVSVHTGQSLDGPTDWGQALQGVTTVVHCAARVHQLQDRVQDPLQAFRQVNRDGTMALARQAAQAGVRRLVFVSTIGVNGASTSGQPFTAASTPSPHSPYAISKWEAEQGLQALSADTGMEVAIVRPPMVIGADAPGNVERLLRLLDRGLPLPLASVDNRRSFVACQTLVDLLERLVDHPAAPGTWLVNDGDDLSTPQLLRCAAEALGRPARLFPLPVSLLKRLLLAGGKAEMVNSLVASLQIDGSQTRRTLGWTPPSTTAQAMREAALAYRARNPRH